MPLEPCCIDVTGGRALESAFSDSCPGGCLCSGTWAPLVEGEGDGIIVTSSQNSGCCRRHPSKTLPSRLKTSTRWSQRWSARASSRPHRQSRVLRVQEEIWPVPWNKGYGFRNYLLFIPNEIKEDIVSFEPQQAWGRRACYIMKMTITEIEILFESSKKQTWHGG